MTLLYSPEEEFISNLSQYSMICFFRTLDKSCRLLYSLYLYAYGSLYSDMSYSLCGVVSIPHKEGTPSNTAKSSIALNTLPKKSQSFKNSFVIITCTPSTSSALVGVMRMVICGCPLSFSHLIAGFIVSSKLFCFSIQLDGLVMFPVGVSQVTNPMLLSIGFIMKKVSLINCQSWSLIYHWIRHESCSRCITTLGSAKLQELSMIARYISLECTLIFLRKGSREYPILMVREHPQVHFFG